MDIRTPRKHFKEFDKLFRNKGFLDVVLTEDTKIKAPIIMIKYKDGTIKEWTRGYKNVKSFLKFGIVKLIDKCPLSFLRLGKCKAEKCQWFYIKNGTGDCSIRWNVIV